MLVVAVTETVRTQPTHRQPHRHHAASRRCKHTKVDALPYLSVSLSKATDVETGTLFRAADDWDDVSNEDVKVVWNEYLSLKQPTTTTSMYNFIARKLSCRTCNISS
jgi:hypothetical protein